MNGNFEMMATWRCSPFQDLDAFCISFSLHLFFNLTIPPYQFLIFWVWQLQYQRHRCKPHHDIVISWYQNTKGIHYFHISSQPTSSELKGAPRCQKYTIDTIHYSIHYSDYTLYTIYSTLYTLHYTLYMHNKLALREVLKLTNVSVKVS